MSRPRWADTSLPIRTRVLLFVCDHAPCPVTVLEASVTLHEPSRKMGDELRELVAAGWLEREKYHTGRYANGVYLYRVAKSRERAA